MNYQRIYDSIINRAKSEERIKSKDTYYEAHHIIPICLGGDGTTRRWRTHPNIVLLTGREHFLCHWLLHEIYPENKKLTRAFVMMCNVKDKFQQRYTPSSRVIEYARMLHIQYSRGSTGYWKGKHLTEEAKEKLRQHNIGNSYALGNKHTLDQREKNRQYHLGNSHSQETRNKMSKTRLGKKQPEIICPHCHKVGGSSNLKRWHFDNCKKKS